MTAHCFACGAGPSADPTYCTTCGAMLLGQSDGDGDETEVDPSSSWAPPVGPPATGPGPTMTPEVTAALPRLHRYVAGEAPPAEVPGMLWVAIGLLVTAGLFVVLPGLAALPDAFTILDAGVFGRTLGLLFLVLLLLLISFGSACFYLAVKLLQADRAGRILTIILAASLGFGLLVADNKGTAEILAILGCGAVAFILWLVPEVVDFFTGPHAAQAEVATSVVAARSIVVALSWVLGATGFAFLPLGELQARFVVVGLIMLAGAAVAFTFSARLLSGDDEARLVVTGLMIVYIVAIVAVEPDGAGLLIPIALAGSVIGLLWGPQDARDHFDPQLATR